MRSSPSTTELHPHPKTFQTYLIFFKRGSNLQTKPRPPHQEFCHYFVVMSPVVFPKPVGRWLGRAVYCCADAAAGCEELKNRAFRERSRKNSRDTCGERRGRRKLIEKTILQLSREPTTRLDSRDNSAVGKTKSFPFHLTLRFPGFSSFLSSFHSSLTVETVTCFNLQLL